MKLLPLARGDSGRIAEGFTLAETVVAMATLAIACDGIYWCLSFTFGMVQSTRENLRATQILLQEIEVLRLCNWTQTSPTTNFVPTSISEPFYADSTVTNGPFYQVTVTITNFTTAASESYSNDLRLVQLQ